MRLEARPQFCSTVAPRAELRPAFSDFSPIWLAWPISTEIGQTRIKVDHRAVLANFGPGLANTWPTHGQHMAKLGQLIPMCAASEQPDIDERL